MDLLGNIAHVALAVHWVLDVTPPRVWLQLVAAQVPPHLAGAVISSSWPVLTRSTQLRFVVGASEQSARVWQSVDNGTWRQVQGSEFNLTVSVDGRHLLRLKAMDAVGNVYVNSSAWSWVLDTTAPTSCRGLLRPPCRVNGTVNSTTCTLDVHGDESLVRMHYKVDHSPDWSITNSTVAVVAVHHDGKHTVLLKVRGIIVPFLVFHLPLLCAKGVDEAGNVSPYPCGSVTWLVDTTGPHLSVISPSNNTVTRNRTMTLQLKSNEPLSQLLGLLPGNTMWTKVAAVSSWSESQQQIVGVVASVSTDGLHCLAVKGVDLVSNVAMQASRYCWELDTTAPRSWLTGSEVLPVLTNRTQLQFSCGWSEKEVMVWWAVDGMGWTLLRNTLSFTAAVTDDGQHSLWLKTVDGVGNEHVNRSVWTWTVDLAPPTAVFTAVPAASSVERNPQFQVACTSVDPHNASDCAYYSYAVTLAPLSGCTSLVTHTGLVGKDGRLQLSGVRSGQNTLKVTAVDAVGLWQLVPVTYTWVVKVLATDLLDVNITSGPPAVSAWKSATLKLFAHRNQVPEPRAVFEVKRGKSPWTRANVSCDSNATSCNYTLLDLELGLHEVQIRARRVDVTIPGQSSLWRWSVEECSPEKYADVDR